MRRGANPRSRLVLSICSFHCARTYTINLQLPARLKILMQTEDLLRDSETSLSPYFCCLLLPSTKHTHLCQICYTCCTSRKKAGIAMVSTGQMPSVMTHHYRVLTCSASRINRKQTAPMCDGVTKPRCAISKSLYKIHIYFIFHLLCLADDCINLVSFLSDIL